MGNNNEIRKRMETYRTVLLAVVWIAGFAGMIGGIVMISYKTGGGWYSESSYTLRPFGIALLIVSILGSIICHFLVNVGLAIPFILLNNGDYLAAIVPEGKQLGINNIPVDNQTIPTNQQKVDYITNRAIYLFLEPDLRSTNLGTLSEGIKLTFLEKGNDIFIDSINAPWFKVKSENNDIGWCFSGYLNKV